MAVNGGPGGRLRLADLQIVDSRLDDFLDIVSGIVAGSLTAVFLSPWVGVPVGVAAGRIETEWKEGG